MALYGTEWRERGYGLRRPNAGKTEFPDKVSPAWAFLPVVNCVSPASAFRHQGQFQRMKEENIITGSIYRKN
jgi:hypothetical protein